MRKLNPSEVEAQLLKFPSVKQAIVFGIPSALRHEEAIACVSGPVTPAALMAHAQTVLSSWQVPKDIWLVEEIRTGETGRLPGGVRALATFDQSVAQLRSPRTSQD